MTAADGSGLSRDNRVSAADLTTLLRHLHQSDHRELLLNSLAVAHTSGTLERRFAARGLAGKLRGKTGTINGVRAFTGLLPTRSGRLLAVSFLYNSISDADAYWKAIEAAMLELRAL